MVTAEFTPTESIDNSLLTQVSPYMLLYLECVNSKIKPSDTGFSVDTPDSYTRSWKRERERAAREACLRASPISVDYARTREISISRASTQRATPEFVT